MPDPGRSGQWAPVCEAAGPDDQGTGRTLFPGSQPSPAVSW